MNEPERFPQFRNARLETVDGRLYLWFHDGIVERRKLLGNAPSDWPKDSIPAGKKRYGKVRAGGHPEREYHKPQRKIRTNEAYR